MKSINRKNETMKRLTALAAAVLNKDYDSIRGFDTESKVLCSYIVKKILDFDDEIISTFFRMPVHAMRDRWEDLSLEIMISNEISLNVMKVERIWVALTDKTLQV